MQFTHTVREENKAATTSHGINCSFQHTKTKAAFCPSQPEKGWEGGAQAHWGRALLKGGASHHAAQREGRGAQAHWGRALLKGGASHHAAQREGRGAQAQSEPGPCGRKKRKGQLTQAPSFSCKVERQNLESKCSKPPLEHPSPMPLF
jgi:hypothetical protein